MTRVSTQLSISFSSRFDGLLWRFVALHTNSESRYGPSYAEEALGVLQNANYWCNDDGTEVFDINGFRITQTADGLVKYVSPIGIVDDDDGDGTLNIRNVLNGVDFVSFSFRLPTQGDALEQQVSDSHQPGQRVGDADDGLYALHRIAGPDVAPVCSVSRRRWR